MNVQAWGVALMDVVLKLNHVNLCAKFFFLFSIQVTFLQHCSYWFCSVFCSWSPQVNKGIDTIISYLEGGWAFQFANLERTTITRKILFEMKNNRTDGQVSRITLWWIWSNNENNLTCSHFYKLKTKLNYTQNKIHATRHLKVEY